MRAEKASAEQRQKVEIAVVHGVIIRPHYCGCDSERWLMTLLVTVTRVPQKYFIFCIVSFLPQ